MIEVVRLVTDMPVTVMSENHIRLVNFLSAKTNDEEQGIRKMPSRSLSRIQIGGNVGKDGNRTDCDFPVLFSPSDLRPSLSRAGFPTID